jgi:selenide,water dikinase
MTITAADQVRLTEWTSCGGCAAKWGAGPLRALVAQVAATGPTDGLLVGLAPFDDAAVLALTDDLALVSTTDFFPPLVDDPGDFGAIAAANACSDVFAMGGDVRLAVNVAAFPEELPAAAIEAIFAAAAETVRAAGGIIAGGHTIRSQEPIFGLAVQGTVHPDRIWTKGGARPGDVLVLSKPLGTGIVLAGGRDADRAQATAGMRQLNRQAAAQLREATDANGPNACTDVTGYGLLGHGAEMAEHSGAVVAFTGSALPAYPGALAAAAGGVRTGGDARNRAALEGRLTVGDGLDPAVLALGLDPQTSGGLLAAVGAEAAAALVDDGWSEVGAVHAGPAGVRLA